VQKFAHLAFGACQRQAAVELQALLGLGTEGIALPTQVCGPQSDAGQPPPLQQPSLPALQLKHLRRPGLGLMNTAASCAWRSALSSGLRLAS